MGNDWQELTDLTGGADFVVERVRLTQNDVALEGSFEPPALARLTAEDQLFVAAFVGCHGSIKRMEKLFGISYPTVKNRLNRIAQRLPFVETDPPPSRMEVLEQIENGELTVDEGLKKLKR